MTQIEVSRVKGEARNHGQLGKNKMQQQLQHEGQKPWRFSKPNLQYETTIHIPILAKEVNLHQHQTFQYAIVPQSDSFSKINISTAESHPPLSLSRALPDKPLKIRRPSWTAWFGQRPRKLLLCFLTPCGHCVATASGEKRKTNWEKLKETEQILRRRGEETEKNRGKKSWAERPPLQIPRSTSKSSDHSHDFREVQRPQMPKTIETT